MSEYYGLSRKMPFSAFHINDAFTLQKYFIRSYLYEMPFLGFLYVVWWLFLQWTQFSGILHVTWWVFTGDAIFGSWFLLESLIQCSCSWSLQESDYIYNICIYIWYPKKFKRPSVLVIKKTNLFNSQICTTSYNFINYISFIYSLGLLHNFY